MKTYLVTGATGFIGGALARRLLSRDNRVVALCRDGSPPFGCVVVRGELEDMRTCERAIVEHRPDGVFHLAAQAMVEHAKADPFSTMESNVRGTYTLLEAYRRHRFGTSRFVMASSDKAYGELPEGASAYTEDMPLQGRGPYDCSKSCGDLIAQCYSMEYGLSLGIVRAGNVYGPGDYEPTRIVPSLMEDVARGRALTIRSDGTPVRDYVYVDDVTAGYIAVMEDWFDHSGDGPGTFNLSSKNPLSVSALAEHIIEAARVSGDWRADRFLSLQKRVEVLGTRTGEISVQVLDPSKAKNLLKWEAQMPLQQGLIRTLKWHLDRNLR